MRLRRTDARLRQVRVGCNGVRDVVGVVHLVVREIQTDIVREPRPGAGRLVGKRRRGQRLGVGDEGRPRTPVVQVPQVLQIAGGPARRPVRSTVARHYGQREPTHCGRRRTRVRRTARHDSAAGET